MTEDPRNVFNSRRAYRIDRMRIGQRNASLKVEECVYASKAFIAIVLPTRYGKTHVIRATAGQLVQHGFACCALVLSPNSVVRNQLTDDEKTQAFVDLLEPTFTMERYKIESKVIDPGCNGEWLLSANIQIVQRNLHAFSQWVESKVKRTGKTVLVYIDEAHTGSVANKWGEVAKVLSRHGATIILVTATPYRADGELIVGFQTEVLGEEEYSKIVPSAGSTPDMVKLSVFEGTRKIIRLKADYEYPLKLAWEENPLPIAKIEWLPFAVNVEEITKGESKWLSELKPSQVRGMLGRITRDPITMVTGIRLQVAKLRELKQKVSDIAGITFCGNDKEDDPENNAHVQAVAKLLKQIAPDLKIMISTCSSDEDDDDVITRFSKGEGDILVVKQRGGLGLDVGRLKVGLDLSSVRTRAAFYQRTMRIATVYKGLYGITICPDEPISAAHFRTIVTDNGGEMVVTDLEKVSEEEFPRKDQPEKDFYTVKGTAAADFGDSDQNWGDAPLMERVEQFRKLVPAVVGVMSHAQIAALILETQMEFKIPTEENTQKHETNVRILSLRMSVVGTMDEITKIDRNARGLDRDDDKEDYGYTSSSWYRKLYKAANLPFSHIRENINIAVLELLKQTATRMLAEIHKGRIHDEA